MTNLKEGDYICHIPDLTLRRVVEVDEDGTLLARAHQHHYPTRIDSKQCRLLPKRGERVCIMAASWMRHLSQQDSYRESIALSQDEAFWLQQIAIITKISTTTGTATIASGNRTLIIPYICLALHCGTLSEVAA